MILTFSTFAVVAAISVVVYVYRRYREQVFIVPGASVNARELSQFGLGSQQFAGLRGELELSGEADPLIPRSYTERLIRFLRS